MKKETRKKIQKIIDEKYLTSWEFTVNVIAPEIEEEEFDLDEICNMIYETKTFREIENNTKLEDDSKTVDNKVS